MNDIFYSIGGDEPHWRDPQYDRLGIALKAAEKEAGRSGRVQTLRKWRQTDDGCVQLWTREISCAS